MEDTNIVKALECCGKNHVLGKMSECKDCHLKNSTSCITELIYQSLDLINRQKAEIERLKFNLKAVLDERADHTEAYKEFAELVHCHCQDIINQPHNEKVKPLSWKVAYEEFDEYVDNLLKELVGEDE